MIELLNEDLSREYQAIIAYVIYSQTIKGAEYNHIAKELEVHAGEELSHALQIAKQIDYLNGSPTNKPKEVKVSEDPKGNAQVRSRERARDDPELSRPHPAGRCHGEFALGETLRKIISQEQEHLQDPRRRAGHRYAKDFRIKPRPSRGPRASRVVHAAWKLKPPVMPSMSSNSPAKCSPGVMRLSIVRRSTSVSGTPPQVTNSSLFRLLPLTVNSVRLS